MYNIQQDLGNYNFISVVDDATGVRIGTMAFYHRTPALSVIKDIVRELKSSQAHVSAHDVVVKLIEMGYDCGMVIESGDELRI